MPRTLPTLSTTSSIATASNIMNILKGSYNQTLAAIVNVPTDKIIAAQLFTLQVSITEGGGRLTISDTQSRQSLGGTVISSSSNTVLTLTATSYTINKLISFIGYTPLSGYLGRVTIYCNLLTTSTNSLTGVTTSVATHDTMVLYYNVEATNTAPVISVSRNRAAIKVNEWTSLSLSTLFGITLSDIDTLISSTFAARPLRLIVLSSPQGVITTLSSSDITLAETSGDLSLINKRSLEIVGTLTTLQVRLHPLSRRSTNYELVGCYANCSMIDIIGNSESEV
jgi:hypothetical protein